MTDFTKLMLSLVSKKAYIPFLPVTIVKWCPGQIFNRVSSSASDGYQRTIPKMICQAFFFFFFFFFHIFKILISWVFHSFRKILGIYYNRNRQLFYYLQKSVCENTLYNTHINLKNSQKKISYSVSVIKFKTGYANHKQPLKHQEHKNDMQLSSKLGKIKNANKEIVIVWKMLRQSGADPGWTLGCCKFYKKKLNVEIM